MKLLPLTKGLFAQVDDEDFEYFNQWKWSSKKGNSTYYATRGTTKANEKKGNYYLHREIMKAKKGEHVDHKDHNGLNCQKSNMRIASLSQNKANTNSHKDSKSKYLGVSKHHKSPKFVAQLSKDGKHYYLGLYVTEELAAKAYNEAAIKHHGEFANLNKIS